MNRRLPFAIIMLTLVIDAMGIGLMMPVMPDLIREVTGSDITNAALWGGILSAIFAAMQFLFSPTVGNLSDRFGRRPVLLISLFAMAVDYLVMALASSIWFLLAARIVGGITAATQSTAAAYIADISGPKDKAANFGLVGAAFGAGFVLGPLIGGVLGEYGTRAPFYAAAALSALNFTLGWFALPETVTDAIRRPFSWRRANPLGAFAAVARLPGTRGLLLFAFVTAFAGYVYPSVWPYFGVERFGWTPGILGLSLGIFGASMALVQGVLIRPVLRRLGEARTVLLGVAFNMVGFVGIALVPVSWIILALTPIAALGGLSGPALTGILSGKVGDDAQGELQGLLTSLNAVAIIMAPVAMTRVFATFSGPDAPLYAPGAPFLLSFALVACSVPIFLAAIRR